MKKIVLTLNILLFAIGMAGDLAFINEGGLERKAFCCGCFALMGLVNLVYALCVRAKGRAFQWVMALGLVLALSGDMLLGRSSDSFILGAGLFALGHVCYFIAHCIRMPFRKSDALWAGVIFVGAGAFLLLCPLLNFPDVIMEIACWVYAVIISLMAGKAVSGAFRKPSVLTVVLAVGSVLFFFSDLMLVFAWFIGLWDWTGTACMLTYIPAQCLLAFSGYLKANEQ